MEYTTDLLARHFPFLHRFPHVEIYVNTKTALKRNDLTGAGHRATKEAYFTNRICPHCTDITVCYPPVFMTRT